MSGRRFLRNTKHLFAYTARLARISLTPRSATLRSRLQNGAVVQGKNTRGFGGRGIYLLRDDVEAEFTQLERLLDPGGVLLDIGANTGIYTLKAARFFEQNGGQIFAVEPFSECLAALADSVRLNGFQNVMLCGVAASDVTGPVTLWRNYEKPNSFSLLKKDAAARPMRVLAVSVDDLMQWVGSPRVTYVKVDVEGAESSVLQGAQATLETDRPIIQIEDRFDKVRPQLEGYLVYRAPQSANKVYLPAESQKNAVARQAGWKQIR